MFTVTIGEMVSFATLPADQKRHVNPLTREERFLVAGAEEVEVLS
jgi:hypothetical protein